MCLKIAIFTNSIQGQSSKHKQVVRLLCSGGVWRIDPSGDVEASQHPVMEAVLEDVPEGHGRRGESMNEQCFQLTLHEVAHYKQQSERLQVRALGWSVRVDIRSQSVDDRVDEHRAGVFNDEHGAPADLGPKILHVYRTLVSHACSMHGRVFCIVDD